MNIVLVLHHYTTIVGEHFEPADPVKPFGLPNHYIIAKGGEQALYPYINKAAQLSYATRLVR